jgi:hypothetical protein
VYTCTSDPGQNHLFVGLKQGQDVATNPSTETNPNITAFYSTNWKSDSGVNALNCDGLQHKRTIVLKTQPGFTPTSNLTAGPALLQLCMFDAAAPDGTFDYTMQTVTAGAGR